MAPKGTALGIKKRQTKPQGGSREQQPPAKVISEKTAPEKRKRPEQLIAEASERKRRRNENLMASKAKNGTLIIMAIDIGTTYLAIAYLPSHGTLSDLEVLSRWTGGQNDVAEKVPCRIAYAHENDLETDRFGYDVEPGMTACQWFKLLLDANTKRTDYDDPQLDRATGSGLMRLPPGKSGKQILTDYLKLVHQHVFEQLGTMIGAMVVKQTAFRFQVSLPSAWSFAAREATRQAAIEAGFGSGNNDELYLIDEPEAAAIWAIKSTERTVHDDKFQKNTCLISVDMGGGTVDIVSYVILETKPLQLEEACVGQGAKIGATAIDRSLHQLMESRFGFAFTTLPIQKTGAGSRFMNDFEEIKRNYKGKAKSRRVQWIPLKMKLDKDNKQHRQFYDFSEDTVMISSDDLEEMFEPVLSRTFGLVREQKMRIEETQPSTIPIRTVVLSGGLGSSEHVFDQFGKFVKDEFDDDQVEVLRPRRPWSAVARGAVIHALEKGPVLWRRSRYHIGLCVHEEFNPKKHRPEDRFECASRGARAGNQMKWKIVQGKPLSTNTKKELRCYTVVERTTTEIKKACFQQVLYGCSIKPAPSRFNDSVFAIGTIKVDLTTIAQEERARHKEVTGKYPKFLVFDLVIEITLSSDKGYLEVAARVGRQKVGKAVVEFVNQWGEGSVNDAADDDNKDDSDSEQDRDGEE